MVKSTFSEASRSRASRGHFPEFVERLAGRRKMRSSLALPHSGLLLSTVLAAVHASNIHVGAAQKQRSSFKSQSLCGWNCEPEGSGVDRRHMVDGVRCRSYSVEGVASQPATCFLSPALSLPLLSCWRRGLDSLSTSMKRCEGVGILNICAVSRDQKNHRLNRIVKGMLMLHQCCRFARIHKCINARTPRAHTRTHTQKH